MSLSTRIAAHLPYLRRFARATTGSQSSGDTYVALALETLIEDVNSFPTTSSDKVGLYKLFCKLVETSQVDIKEIESPYGWEKRAANKLAGISTKARNAFLLNSVEDFDHDQVAEILDLEKDEVTNVLDQAHQEIARQVATNVMIIEDEPLIAMDIEQMVEGLGHSVTGIARTHDEARTLYSRKKPGIVLADIQLADGSSGIDAVNEILTQDDLPVIFITAYPERLLTGERPEPTFLVTKPFREETVKALISQALFFDNELRS
ncbi:response regulator [Maritalea porphyrae]|uniref:Response regulator n=1 Tax=Maritalea porphyrae TaxID=880732 RepID=A0ABQ5UMP7_9HYPH|nr:response regulator [Maritalea porphyrae]GLQ15947.1 response regulator [Maritalea porphyrae]